MGKGKKLYIEAAQALNKKLLSLNNKMMKLMNGLIHSWVMLTEASTLLIDIWHLWVLPFIFTVLWILRLYIVRSNPWRYKCIWAFHCLVLARLLNMLGFYKVRSYLWRHKWIKTFHYKACWIDQRSIFV